MHCIRPIFYPFFIVRQIAKKREMDWVNMDWMNKQVDGLGLDDEKVTLFKLCFLLKPSEITFDKSLTVVARVHSH